MGGKVELKREEIIGFSIGTSEVSIVKEEFFNESLSSFEERIILSKESLGRDQRFYAGKYLGRDGEIHFTIDEFGQLKQSLKQTIDYLEKENEEFKQLDLAGKVLFILGER